MNRTLAISVLVLSLAGCKTVEKTDGRMSVTASFYPLAFLAEQIGGELVSVDQITPPGVEPHDYEPTPAQVVDMYSSKVFLMNGGGIDAWGDKLIYELSAKNIRTVLLTDHILMIHDHPEGEEHRDDEEIESDPHVWLSVKNMMSAAEEVEASLSSADPENKNYYAKNAESLILKLENLNQEFIQGLSNCSQNKVIVSHDAFGYLAHDYGFETLAIAGLDPESEPSAKRIAELSDFAKANNIQHIFFETLVSDKLAETIANEVGATPLVLNPIEGLTDQEQRNGEDYISLMQMNLKNLRTALQCQ